MQVLPHILTTLTTPWTAWAVLGMLLLIGLIEWLHPGFIVNTYRMAFSNHDRFFGDHSTTFISSLCMVVYQVVTFTFVFILCTTSPQTLQATCFVQIMLLFISYILVQKIGYWIVSYTFDFQTTFSPNLRAFSSLRLSLALAFFPMCLLMLHTGKAAWLQGVIITLVGIYLLIFLTKVIRTFWDGLASLPYLLLYLLTLEILPLGLVFMGACYIC